MIHKRNHPKSNKKQATSRKKLPTNTKENQLKPTKQFQKQTQKANSEANRKKQFRKQN